MLIRRGLVTDLFELSRLWSHMVQESEDLLPNLEMWRGYIVNLMGYKGYFMWVAEEDNELVGFIDYAMQPEPAHGIWIATINYFYVAPAYRDQEVSGQLWMKAIDSAKENGAKEFSSICFDDKLEFWEKHGFTRQGNTIRRVI